MRLILNTAFLTIVLGFIILFLWKCFDLRINDTSIVLTFIGILATFIVISNYAQVKDVEKKAFEHTKELEDKIIAQGEQYEQANKKALKEVYIKSGYAQESIYIRKNKNSDCIFLIQACEHFLSALELNIDEPKNKDIDAAIKLCLDELKIIPIEFFYSQNIKNDVTKILLKLSEAKYDIGDVLTKVLNAPIR